MEIAGRRADAFGHRGGERDDVMFDFFFNLADALDVDHGFALDVACRRTRNHLRVGLRLGRGNLNVQALAEPVFVGPNATHLRTRVTGYHYWFIPRWS